MITDLKPVTHILSKPSSHVPVFEILIFNIKMNYFGIPVGQIESIQSLPDDASATDIEKIDRVLGYADTCFYLFPSRIIFKSSLNSHYSSHALMIDGMVGIFDIRLNNLLPLPKLIRSCLSGSLIWGAARIEDQGLKDIILLLNFDHASTA
jgi:chemotaxis signal transduction protein